MARPVNANAAATRQRILSAALTLFAEQGTASIRAIAGEAGVSVAMISHYFGGKDALYDACVEQMYAELSALQEQLLPLLTSGDTVDELLPMAVRRGFRFACEHRLAMRMLNRQVIEAGTLSADRRLRFQAPFLALITAAFAHTGRPAAQIRLSAQTVVMLLARYAISTPEELGFFVQGGREEALLAVEDHLVEVACSLLLKKFPQADGAAG